MFTGIIEEIGTINKKKLNQDGVELGIYAKKVLNDLTSEALPNTSIVINLLSQNNRVDMLLDVCIGFIKQYNVQKGIVEVKVTSAVEVSEDMESSIKEYLQSLKKGKIKLTKKHDKSLIAGFILDYDNIRLDASVKKRLDKMKKQLKATN